MSKLLKITFLDCLLRGKFTRAGEGITQLYLKDLTFSEPLRSELELALNCVVSRSRSSGVMLTFNISCIHLKSAIKGARALIDCMSDSDTKLFLRFSVCQLFSIFRSLCSIPYDMFIKTLKYYTAYPLAFYLQNDLPEAPCDFGKKYPFLGNNAIQKWWKHRLFSVCHKRRNLTLFWSLLQGVKRACEFADDSFIKSSMEKHKDLLSRTHPWDDQLTNRYMEAFEDYFKAFTPEDDLTYEMSNSSCYEYTRSGGGQRGYLLDKVNGVSDYDNEAKILRRAVLRLPLGNYLHKMVCIGATEVKEIRGCLAPTWEDLLDLAQEQPHCMVQAILEPLKVRLITKGPASNYFMAKSFQKQLFKYLRRSPQFELIGDPLRPDHIYRMMEREKGLPMEFSHFVSGDYSSATDNLGIQYTMIGMNASLQNYRGPFRSQLKSALFEHQIHYPKKFEIGDFLQNNGQLMGSPLSFPFLCLTNMIAYKLSLEDYLEKEVSFNKLPCLVNGDDILFRTNPDHYEIWKKHVADIGFSLSVGKNYIHEKILTINSTMFQLNNNNILEKIDYCNFGLLSGTSKLGASRGAVRERAVDLADAYVRSVGGATDKSLAMSRFMVRNAEAIAKVTMRGRYNLFLPRVLGGLGLPVYDGVHFHVTRFQRLLAKLVVKGQDFSPLFGFKTDTKSNMVMGYESKNKKLVFSGYGPFPEGFELIQEQQYRVPNTSYCCETETRWFSRIPQRYNAAQLFPFRLKESDKLELEMVQMLQYKYTPGEEEPVRVILPTNSAY